MRTKVLWGSLALAAVALGATPTSAQQAGADSQALRLFAFHERTPPPTGEGRGPGPTIAALASQGGAGRAPGWWAPLASAVLPGSGQVLLRQTRAVPYAALEIFAVTQYLRTRREARDRRSDYRDLARVVARARFGTPTPVGDFEYYERLEHFTKSGEFDLVPGGELDPETDVDTYNGSVWLLARRTFWGDPDVPPPLGSPQYQEAIRFYSQRAVGDHFRWSWEGAELEQDQFRRTIRRSNDAFREASQFLGVLLANHALSTVDAIITVRLQNSTREAEQRVGVRVEVPFR